MGLKRLILLILSQIISLSILQATELYTPKEGSELRKELMNILRPYVQEKLGLPVRFKIEALQISGNYAFTHVDNLHPHGKSISLQDVLKEKRNSIIDNNPYATLAFYKKSGKKWKVVDYKIGLREVWLHEYCNKAHYHKVIPKSRCHQSKHYYIPKRGSTLRQTFMNRLRPIVEKEFGAPVRFVIDTLRVSGKYAFAHVYPIRPSGKNIGSETICQNCPPSRMNLDVEALYKKSGKSWVVIAYDIANANVDQPTEISCEENEDHKRMCDIFGLDHFM